jgi:hypothetical protein
VKPWGGPQSVGDPGPAPPLPFGAPAALGLGPVSMPPSLFAPAARECMADVGWAVCSLGRSGVQTVRNVFAGAAQRPVTGLAAPVRPVVVLALPSGAALAFYPPPGFYSTTQRHADSGGGEVAWGTVVVSAWRVDPGADSTLWIDLAAMGPVGAGNDIAANVFVPPEAVRLSAERWPDGRYIVWLKGGGVRSWDEFFDFEIVTSDSGPAGAEAARLTVPGGMGRTR